MQETRAPSLVQEDPICHGAQGLEPQVTTVEAHVLQLSKPLRLEPVLPNKRSHLKEKPMHTINSSSNSPQLGKTLAKQRKLSTAGNT